jgi:signal transduction histidine kinase
MSIRSFFALLILVSLTSLFVIDIFSNILFEKITRDVFTLSLQDNPLLAIHTVLGYQLLIQILIGIFAILISLYVVTRFITRPLRNTLTALQIFIDTGQRAETQAVLGTPTEIQTLDTVLSALIESIQKGHERDIEASRVKSDFISTAAHQLRTPLTGIRWALEALEKQALTAEQQTMVKDALEKSHDLVGIVGTFMDISTIESGKQQYAFEEVYIESLVAQVTSECIPLSEETHVGLVYTPNETPLPQVRVDVEKIKEVIVILIENAIHYTPAGGSVTVSLEQVPGRIQVRIRDTGIGIPGQDRNNIFERFYRGATAVSKENKGNGLNLYIARTVATDHGGDINFNPNTEGPGTTFILSLPFV